MPLRNFYLTISNTSVESNAPVMIPVHDQIQEAALSYNKIKTNSILLDECKKDMEDFPLLNIPVPPLPIESPVVAPVAPNLYDDKLEVANSIKYFLKKPS